MRHVTPEGPAALDSVDGLAYSLWLPDRAPTAAVLIVPGAGSQKENHHDFARACRAAGFAALAADMRGHGESSGALDDRLVADVVALASVLPAGVPRFLRGSSMGAAISLLAAAPAGASGVVAICPAPTDMLLRGLRGGQFEFRADVPALERLLGSRSLEDAVDEYGGPVFFLHAEGDERVPVTGTVALHERCGERSKLVVVPGGHHRSVQHDAELQGVALRWIARIVRESAAG